MDLPSEGNPAGGVASVDVATTIVRALLSLGGSARLKDLEQQTGIHAGTVHRYLVSLVRSGLVRREENSTRYAFGLLAYQIGLLAAHRNDAVTLAAPAVAEFCQHIGETCGIGVWLGTGATIVRWFEANRPVSITLRPGTPLTLTRSSTGQMFAAHLRRKTLEPLLRKELAQEDDVDAAVDKALRALAQVRERGLSRAHGSHIPGISSLSAPVYGPDAQLAFVISAIGNSATFDARLDGKVGEALKAFAAEMSRRMGAQG